MTCKDCIHYIACKSLLESQGYIVDGAGEDADKRCKEFADKSRFVELPCKVGDVVYVLTSDSPTGFEESRVKRMTLSNFNGGMTIKFKIPCVYDDWGKAFWQFSSEDFGKTVFLTKEEAEAELKKRMDEPPTVPDTAEHCVVCGAVIPEGRQVCPGCAKEEHHE